MPIFVLVLTINTWPIPQVTVLYKCHTQHTPHQSCLWCVTIATSNNKQGIETNISIITMVTQV